MDADVNEEGEKQKEVYYIIALNYIFKYKNEFYYQSNRVVAMIPCLGSTLNPMEPSSWDYHSHFSTCAFFVYLSI